MTRVRVSKKAFSASNEKLCQEASGFVGKSWHRLKPHQTPRAIFLLAAGYLKKSTEHSWILTTGPRGEVQTFINRSWYSLSPEETLRAIFLKASGLLETSPKHNWILVATRR